MFTKPPSLRTVLLLTLCITGITVFEHLDYSHPKDDALEQSITTKHFLFTATTYHNRHANRCVNIRCGKPDSARTPLRTSCDVLYLHITKTYTNLSRSLCAPEYIQSQWEAISRTYNDGIVYIGNDVVINDPPLTPYKIHFEGNGTMLRKEWFSLSPFGAGVNVLRQWVKQRKLWASCNHGAVQCHRGVTRYSCDGAMDPRGCRTRGYGASILRAIAITAALWLAIWRVRGTARVLRGGRSVAITISPVLAACIIGVVAFAGMTVADMAWLLARMVGVRFGHAYSGDTISAGDIYRSNGLRGVYEGYAYLWRDGAESVRVSGPGVALVVGLVSVGLFVKRALLSGLLVRCVLATVSVFGGCALVEMALRRGAKKESEDGDYLPINLARQLVKREKGRSFVREKARR